MGQFTTGAGHVNLPKAVQLFLLPVSVHVSWLKAGIFKA